MFLIGAAYSTGCVRPVESLPALRGQSELVERLNYKGVVNFADAAGKIDGLVRSSVAETLSRAGLAARDLDALIVTSGAETGCGPSDAQLLQAIDSAGLGHLSPIGITLSECGNFSVAMRMAQALVAAGQAARVMVLVADLCPDEKRIFGLDTAIHGDGAASCVVSATVAKEGSPALKLLGTYSYTRTSLGGVRPGVTQFKEFLALHLEGIRETAETAFRSSGRAPEEVSVLLASNLNVYVVDFIAAAMRVARDRVFRKNVRRLGHVQGCDGLINLVDYQSTAVQRKGDLVLVSSMGPYSWGVSVLEAE